MINFILNLFGKNNDSRFYYLSLIYENNRWTIHGLWPQNSKDNYPTYCKLVNFDDNKSRILRRATETPERVHSRRVPGNRRHLDGDGDDDETAAKKPYHCPEIQQCGVQYRS